MSELVFKGTSHQGTAGAQVSVATAEHAVVGQLPAVQPNAIQVAPKVGVSHGVASVIPPRGSGQVGGDVGLAFGVQGKAAVHECQQQSEGTQFETGGAVVGAGGAVGRGGSVIQNPC